MLSFKVFERSSGNELQEAYRRAALLILEAVGSRGVAGDESDYDNFRISLDAVIGQLNAPDAKASDILVASGAATTAIQEHNRNEVTAIRARVIELQAVVGMLTQTMAEVAAGSEHSLTRLKDIERRLSKSQENYDVRELRQQMAECLATVKEEVASRRRESEKVVADLQSAALKAKPAAPVEQPRVQTEPEPDRSGIEALIEQAVADGPPLLVAVLVIDHLKTIATRFGEGAAGRVAAFCAEQAKINLRGALHVGVWKGVACVALLDGTAGSEAVERAVMIESQRRRSMSLDIGQRDVMLQASYSKWSIFPASGRPAASVLQNMNSFLAQAAGL